MLTIGVAIAIPEPHGSLLRKKRAEFGDPMASTVPSHVTLMPPLEVAESQLDGVCDALQQTASGLRPFNMELRGTDTFRPVSPVVFVALGEGIAHTEAIATAVHASLRVPAPQFPFHPHVTVAHNLDDATLDRAHDELNEFTCTFSVSAFHLYLHKHVEGWIPTRAFPLGQPV